jgi:hypothetical protein
VKHFLKEKGKNKGKRQKEEGRKNRKNKKMLKNVDKIIGLKIIRNEKEG